MKINKKKEKIVNFKESIKNFNINYFMNKFIILGIPFFYIFSFLITRMQLVEFLAYTFSVPIIYVVYNFKKNKIIKRHCFYIFFFFFVPLVVQMLLMGIDAYNISPENKFSWFGCIIVISYLIFYNFLYYVGLLLAYLILKLIKKYKKSGD